MLKVLFITSTRDGTGRANVGDRVILAGARNLVAGAFGAFAYKEAGRWGKLRVDPDAFDLVVLAGMPQYGARPAPLDAELRFDAVLRAARTAVVINIGGGTPAMLDLDVEALSDRMASAGNAAFFREQGKLALRTSRDLVGKRFFDKIGSPCDLRPCPGFFSTLHLAPLSKERCAIATISSHTFVTTRVRGDMGDHVRRLATQLPGYELTAHGWGDLAMLGRLGEPHVYFRDEMDALDYYNTVARLASARIHAAIPTWVLGGDVVVGGFDGRIHMLADTGMPIPQVNLVAGDIGQLADRLTDPALHLPVAERRALVDAAYLSYVERMREACPSLLDKTAMSGEPPAGFDRYPGEGTVIDHPSGRAFLPPPVHRPPRFVDEDDTGPDGCVVVLRGQVARAGRIVEAKLPLALAAAAFSSSLGEGGEEKLAVPLGVKKGLLASAARLRLPHGRYRATLTFDIVARGPIGERFDIVVQAKTKHETYAETARRIGRKIQAAVLAVEFEHCYPAAELILNVILRRATADATLVLHGATIEMAGSDSDGGGP